MEVFGNSPHNAPTAGLFRSVSCCDKLGVVIHDDGSMTAWDVYDSVHFPGVFLDAVASAVGPTALSASPLCPGDFDADMSQSVNDFIAFQTYFALGDEMCDCEADGQLLIDDFLCFQTLYAIGC